MNLHLIDYLAHGLTEPGRFLQADSKSILLLGVDLPGPGVVERAVFPSTGNCPVLIATLVDCSCMQSDARVPLLWKRENEC